jgi:hypothetical protein
VWCAEFPSTCWIGIFQQCCLTSVENLETMIRKLLKGGPIAIQGKNKIVLCPSQEHWASNLGQDRQQILFRLSETPPGLLLDGRYFIVRTTDSISLLASRFSQSTLL